MWSWRNNAHWSAVCISCCKDKATGI